MPESLASPGQSVSSAASLKSSSGLAGVPPSGSWSAGSAADAVADVGGLGRVDHPNNLQLDARRQHLEQPTASTEQHRDLVDLQLVQHTGLKRPLRRIGAMHHHVAIAGGSLG